MYTSFLGDSLNSPKSISTNNDGPGKPAWISSKIVAKAGVKRALSRVKQVLAEDVMQMVHFYSFLSLNPGCFVMKLE